ncbi:RNA polymerase sigma factor [Pseudonocardia acaciae]|uniref:RNA polymerase sigma factor n=1 Tax=Pseudonocardia acaciae TaxID=551276 RepID=UPI00048BAF58|nr:sigma-70 family RNA polymerase sigma factor [Pseudonocardia acaciae]
MRGVLPADAELVARLRARDEAAFALVVDAWSGGMLRLARSFVSSQDTAAEVVQDAWLAVVRNIGRFEGRAALKTWVYRILVNNAKRRAARDGRGGPMSSLEQDRGPTVDPDRFQGPDEAYPGHWREPPAPWPSPERRALDGELRARLREALDGLPERQRIVITLRDVEGYTADEVCSILEISAANQRVLLHRARAFVRARLEEYFAGGAVTG